MRPEAPPRSLWSEVDALRCDYAKRIAEVADQRVAETGATPAEVVAELAAIGHEQAAEIGRRFAACVDLALGVWEGTR